MSRVNEGQRRDECIDLVIQLEASNILGIEPMIAVRKARKMVNP